MVALRWLHSLTVNTTTMQLQQTISAPCRQMEKASKCRYRGPEIHIFPINVRQYSAEVKGRVVNRWKGQ